MDRMDLLRSKQVCWVSSQEDAGLPPEFYTDTCTHPREGTQALALLAIEDNCSFKTEGEGHREENRKKKAEVGVLPPP